MQRWNFLSGILVLGAFFVGCPPPAGDDAGNDAGPADGPQQDSQAQDTGFDSGCATPCGSITVEGVCQGTVLRYCDDNCLVERDCATAAGGPYSCGAYGAFYECLAGAGQACEPDYWDCDPVTTCNGHFPCDESSGLTCSGGADPVCASGGTDAGTADATTVADSASAPDTLSAPDSATVDAGTADSATAPDTATEDSATAPDAATAEDSATPEDAATTTDAAAEDVPAEDAASSEDAG